MMVHDCQKEREFGEIVTTLKFFQEAEQRREQRETELIGIMKDIAAQGESLKAIVDRVKKTEEDTDNLYARVRELEIKPAEDSDKIRVGFWSALIAAVITFVFGIFLKKG